MSLVKLNGLSNYLRYKITSHFTLGIIAALIIRFLCLPNKSSDYKSFLEPWYNFITEHGGFAALKYDFYDYTPPYIYWLLIASSLLAWLPKIVSIKLVSIIFDFICAYFCYKLVRLKYPVGNFPNKAFLLVIFAPTVIYNSSLWSQCDGIYTAFLLGCLYYLCIQRNALAFICFGISVCFKLQAMFLLPLLLIMWCQRKVSWWHFSWIPLMYLVSILPAFIAGRPLPDLLLIYFNQSQKYKELAKGVPNLYQWIPDYYYREVVPIGLILTTLAILLLTYSVHKNKLKLNYQNIIHLSLISVLLVPYLLPKMHQRYFYPADLLSIVFAFYFPQYYWVPIVVQICSLLSYLGTPILIKACAIALGFTLCFVIYQLQTNLKPSQGIQVHELSQF
jgi:Gpi18-like mannosyltransferase